MAKLNYQVRSVDMRRHHHLLSMLVKVGVLVLGCGAANLLGVNASVDSGVVGQGVFITNATNSPKCLDGSSPLYWITSGTGTGANKWLISFEGGGLCNGIDPLGGGYNNCYDFAYYYEGGYFGTSNSPQVSPTFDFSAAYGNYFSRNSTLNPMMYNWNMVYLHYCDGGLWVGNVPGSVKLTGAYEGQQLYFRGGANAMAVLSDLIDNKGMSAAVEVVVSGFSAGGYSAYNYLDSIANMFPNKTHTRVVGLMDSGFFLDVNYHGCNFVDQVNWIYHNLSVHDYINPACLATQSSNPNNCMFAKYIVPVTTTPIFSIQSRFDSFQYTYILCNDNDQSLIYNYSVSLTNAYFNSGLNSGMNGGLLDDCPHHYYYYNFSVPNPHFFDPWNSIYANNGMNQMQGFQIWYEGGGKSTSATNLTQYPVPHGLDFSCCTSAWMDESAIDDDHNDGSSSHSYIASWAIAIIVVGVSLALAGIVFVVWKFILVGT